MYCAKHYGKLRCFHMTDIMLIKVTVDNKSLMITVSYLFMWIKRCPTKGHKNNDILKSIIPFQEYKQIQEYICLNINTDSMYVICKKGN